MVGHELLSSLDAFKRYHQILMAKKDMPKTFVTRVEIYFCTRMPFRLRNARLNFQEEMKKSFGGTH